MRGSTGFVKPLLIILAVIAVVIVGAFAIAGLMGGDKDLGKAVDFTANDINGEPFTLSDAYGKRPTVLVFLGKLVAADGKESMTGDTLLTHLKDAVGERDVRLVVVARADDGSVAEKLLADNGITVDALIPDEALTISQLYNINACPITYFIDENGSVRSVSLSNLTRTAADKYIGFIAKE